jgi:hypothetical protein
MKYAYRKLGYKGHYIFDKIVKDMFYFLFVKIYLIDTLQKFTLHKINFKIHILRMIESLFYNAKPEI